MDYKEFYSQLYAPLVRVLGPADRDTIVAIVGFDAGGATQFLHLWPRRRSEDLDLRFV
jgi:hypothetical protein